jgi:hypothetical protein
VRNVAECCRKGYHLPMWSDRWWWVKCLGTVAVIGVLAVMFTDFATHRPAGIRAAITDPPAHDGQTIQMPLWWVTGIEGPTRYFVSKTLSDVPIVGATDDLDVGDTVSIRGTFRASDGAVVQTQRELHHLRPWKAAFSLLGLLLGVLLVPRFFGWRAGRVVIRG